MAAVDAFEARIATPHSIDRWAYAGLAGLLALTGVVGFGPRSAAILIGETPNPPLVVHVHAAMMALWLGLLFTQAVLVAAGQRRFHRTLGVAAFVLGPALVAAMIAVTIWRFDQRVDMGQAAGGANTLLAQLRSIVCFSIFFTWAVAARKGDLATHKRMMILATVVLLPAALFRMTWLPTTMPASYFALHAYMLALLVPALSYDVIRLGRVHRAYWIGLAVLAPWLIATHFLWGNEWWHETALRFMPSLT